MANLINKWNEYNAPLKRNVTIDDVGGSGLYFLSDFGSPIEALRFYEKLELPAEA